MLGTEVHVCVSRERVVTLYEKEGREEEDERVRLRPL